MHWVGGKGKADNGAAKSLVVEPA
ncbi:hypothetical protein HaLaN_05014, partial [Haematococcus lacustris]